MKVAELSKHRSRDNDERVVIWRRLLSIDKPHIIVWSADFAYDDAKKEIVLVIGNGEQFEIEHVGLNAEPIAVSKEVVIFDPPTASPQILNESKKTIDESKTRMQIYRTSFPNRRPSNYDQITIESLGDEWCIRLKDSKGKTIENYYSSKSTGKVREEVLQDRRSVLPHK